MAWIQLEHVSKSFDGKQVLKGISLQTSENESIAILGLSGSGKTTLLRLLAGLESPDEGSVRLNGVLMDTVPPQARNVGMVFQNHSVYPNLSVSENLGISLRLQKVHSNEIREKVCKIAEVLGIGHLLDRSVTHLSGGERQRVALGKAIAKNPNFLLLDEPLSNVDEALREDIIEFVQTFRDERTKTIVLVTHDQEEAFAIADRVAILLDGEVLQFDSPQALFSRPQSLPVVELIGWPRANIFEGRFKTLDAKTVLVETPFGGMRVHADLLPDKLPDTFVTVAVRPQNMSFSIDRNLTGATPAVIRSVRSLGDFSLVELEGPSSFKARFNGNRSTWKPGDEVVPQILSINLFDPVTKEAIQ